MKLALIPFISATLADAATSRHNSSPLLKREKINPGLRAIEKVSVADFPADFFWGDVNGTNFLTESRNQHIPQVMVEKLVYLCSEMTCFQYCGACWAFGTLSSLADRLKIARKAASPDIIFPPQVLINCNGGGSCEGGDVGGVFDYLDENGIPDETCQVRASPRRLTHAREYARLLLRTMHRSLTGTLACIDARPTPRNFAHALVDARARAQNYEAVDGECKPYGVCETCSPGPGGAAGPPVKNCTKVHNRHPLHRTTPRGGGSRDENTERITQGTTSDGS
jgi:hypothetical protein